MDGLYSIGRLAEETAAADPEKAEAVFRSWLPRKSLSVRNGSATS